MVQVTPWLSTLCSFAVEVVTLVLCQVLVGSPSGGLQCLWIPWYCGVPGLSVGSPVSGGVCVLIQSTIVRLLSLLDLTFGLRAGSSASG